MSSLEIKVGPPCTWSLNKARIHHCSALHPINKHSGFTPLVIVTLEPGVFKVHKSWGGLGFRPPQYFIHTKSFNQDQSSAQEHMGPTDAPLIPLGFFFFGCVRVCVSEGCTEAPSSPRSGSLSARSQTRVAHRNQRPAPKLLLLPEAATHSRYHKTIHQHKHAARLLYSSPATISFCI